MKNIRRLKILGIETSCDETAASVIEARRGDFKVWSNIIWSQIKIHQKTGGIVPEVAAREHVKVILPIIKKALPKFKDVDLIAVTRGPGLITSLLVGVETAKVLSYVWQRPLIGINHLEGHIYSNWVTEDQKIKREIQCPALILIVSGGHTFLVLMKGHGKYKVIGQTRDDAAGEAFDKVAKLLKIGYPGGPIIEKLALKGNPQRFNLPKPMIESKDFDFSFSGLKTAVLYFLSKQKIKISEIPDLCATFQNSVIEVLVQKTLRAAKKYQVKTVMLAGGVAANKLLRKTLKAKVKKELPDSLFYLPSPQLCTDNAVMIGVAGYFWAQRKNFDSWQKIKVNPNLEL